jgi:hypothetical protein
MYVQDSTIVASAYYSIEVVDDGGLRMACGQMMAWILATCDRLAELIGCSVVLGFSFSSVISPSFLDLDDSLSSGHTISSTAIPLL